MIEVILLNQYLFTCYNSKDERFDRIIAIDKSGNR